MHELPARPMLTLLLGTMLAMSGCATDAPPDSSTRDAGNTEADARASDATDAAADDVAQDTALPDTQDADEDVAPDVAVDTGEDAATGDTATIDASTGDTLASDTSPADVAPDTAPDTGPRPAGDTCATAVDITSGGLFRNETTADATDDYDADPGATNCPNGRFSGKDKVYVLSPTTTTTYGVSVNPVGNFDPLLYTRTDCSQSACLDGSVLNGAGESESLQIEVQAGQTVYVIVDGELGSEGDYTLGVLLAR